MLEGGLYERTSGAAGQPLAGYRRREPERTVLHELVAQHAQTMLAEVRAADPEGGGLPRYVERELTEYLRCGVLAHGFARVRCTTCHDEIVVAFSCKRRGLCPSCTARRMADTAAHLVDRVLPSAPYRQWVFTVPKVLRLRLARDPAWVTWVGNLAVHAIGAWQRRVARKRGLRAPQTGAVTFVQSIWCATRACSGRPTGSAPRSARWCPRPPTSPPARRRRAAPTGAAGSHWAALLRRVFAADVLACPCGGRRRRVVAVVVDSALARALLAALGLPCTPATFAPAWAPPQAELWFDDAS